MSRGDRQHVGGRLYRWGPVLLVLLVLASAAATYRFDLGERWFGIERADPVDNPAAVAPPEGLDLPEPAPAPAVAEPLPPDAVLDALKVRRALGPRLTDRDLGKHVVAMVAPLGGDQPAFQVGSGVLTPASILKLVTATAALATVGPGATFQTTVVGGTTARDIILVGGGDPYLSSKPVGGDSTGTYPATRADVVTLARRTARALDKSGVTRVRLGYDDSLFAGPGDNPQWEPDYVPDGVVSPITSLWVDRGTDPDGFGRAADPALTAATAFSAALSRAGVTVVGQPTRTRAAAGAAQLAEVESAPLEQIVQQVLTVSDNEGAEVLLRHVGLSVSGDGSFAGGAAGVEQTLRRLDVPLDGAAIYDGSGLSRHDRLSPATVIGVLRVAASASHPELRSVVEGLPVAGFTGSLTNRFDTGEVDGRGRVRAKTGTLTGVHGLAGIAEDLDGNLMAFILVADRVALRNNTDAEAELDRAAAELGACHCGRSR